MFLPQTVVASASSASLKNPSETAAEIADALLSMQLAEKITCHMGYALISYMILR